MTVICVSQPWHLCKLCKDLEETPIINTMPLHNCTGSTVYMTEVKVHEIPSDSWQVQYQDDYRHGNPITNKGDTVLGELASENNEVIIFFY